MIGQGRFGPIYLCESLLDEKQKENNEITYKKMVLIKYDKEKVILLNSLYSILNQLNFYKKYNYLNNPFITKIYYAFQDKTSFYLLKKYYPGGDLRHQINRKILSEQRSKFLIANIILGLEFLHSKGYLYRNLIPENLFFDKRGYLHINDMTLIREISNINYLVTSGNPGYMAPEIIFRQKHGIESDFFSLGVILYEIMFNKLPFKSKTREEYLNDLISNHNALIKEDDLNVGWSRECADFINRCIQKKAELRIGYEGIEELKTHVWMKDFEWEKLRKKELVAPFIPHGNKNFNPRKHEEEKIEYFKENIRNFIEYYETMNYFNGYYYNYNLDENIKKENSNIEEEKNEDKKVEKKEINDNMDGKGTQVHAKDEKIMDVNNNDTENEDEDDIKHKKKKIQKYDDENEYDNENEDEEIEEIELNLNKNKKNKKSKKKREEENYNEMHKESRNKKRKSRKEINDTKNFYEEESKGQLMNININKKGLFNKNVNKRKSVKKRSSKKVEPRESSQLLKLNYKKKNKNH